MKSITIATGALAGAVFASALVAALPSARPYPTTALADAAHPAVIELYQSQGCSSCPPALAVLDRVANRPDVLALNFAVTYWDQLGWKDIYAQPAFTARQWDYAHAQGRGNVQTPQLIVNGRAAVLGSVQPDVERAIVRFARPSGPTLTAARGRVVVGAQRGAAAATVWYVAYDPRTVQVPVRAGENGGRTLPHRNIVRRLTAIGTAGAIGGSFALPAHTPGLADAIVVQAGKGGPIVAAARL